MAQDSLRNDTAVVDIDSLNKVAFQDSVHHQIMTDSSMRLVIEQSFLKILPKGWFFLQKERAEEGKEHVFYYILGLVLMFGILRQIYPRYFADIFRYFFQSTLRIQQVKEQLSQSVLPGVLFSLLYFLTTGMYLFLLAAHYGLSFRISFYKLLFVLVGILIAIYGGKNLFLKLIGWSFNRLKAANLYLFVTFLTNRVTGIILLPFLLGIAFGTTAISNFCVATSETLVVTIFMFRFLRAYQPLKDEFSIGLFHYIAYLIAAELAPLLLIYKILIEYL